MTIGRTFAVVDDATANPLVNAAGVILASCPTPEAAEAAYRLLTGQAEKIHERTAEVRRM